MAKEKKKVGCLGLFMRGFIITVLVLANLSVAGIIVAVQFFQADYVTWTDFSHYTTYPWMLVFGVLGMAGVIGLLMSTVGAAVSLAFGEGGSKQTGSKSTPRAKPQSNRRTTI